MLLRCEIVIHNRLAPALESKKGYATIRFSKKVSKSGEDVCFSIHSAKNMEGSDYTVRGNIVKVHSKFVDEGKCTVGMKAPPHNLIISNAPVDNLKKFLEILKVSFSGGDVTGLINLDYDIKLKLCDLEKPKSGMRILARADYPMRESFPKTLETLEISCSLKKFDVRILKLNQLKILDLSNNKLSSLCDSLDSLACLRKLYLNGNFFQEFPSCVCSGETAKRIGMLDLSDNQIKVLSRKLLDMKNLYTLKLDRNEVEFLPSNFGYMKTLKCFHLNNNKLKILPWSFSLLHLDLLDLSGNSFQAGDEIQFTGLKLCCVPPLFEIAGRYVIKKDMQYSTNILPNMIQEKLSLCRYCPCGNPCISHCVPYVKCIKLSAIAQSVSYDDYLLATKATVKVVGYLCSAACHERWCKNPNTLFTSKQKKRRREPRDNHINEPRDNHIDEPREKRIDVFNMYL